MKKSDNDKCYDTCGTFICRLNKTYDKCTQKDRKQGNKLYLIRLSNKSREHMIDFGVCRHCYKSPVIKLSSIFDTATLKHKCKVNKSKLRLVVKAENEYKAQFELEKMWREINQ